jgi:hypothetical protein
MSIVSEKARRREETLEKRGWILYLLYKWKPKPLPAVSLWRLLDRENMYFSRSTLAEEIDYLRGLRLLDVFPQDATTKLDDVAQSRLVQRFGSCESDEQVGVVMCARINTAGINFQDGIGPDHPGITRVE